MDLENTFIVASIGEQAEKDGLVKKAGETPTVPNPPPSLELVMLRGLLGLDEGEPLMEYHLEQARMKYGIELPRPE